MAKSEGEKPESLCNRLAGLLALSKHRRHKKHHHGHRDNHARFQYSSERVLGLEEPFIPQPAARAASGTPDLESANVRDAYPTPAPA